jgi:hypothetical protein
MSQARLPLTAPSLPFPADLGASPPLLGLVRVSDSFSARGPPDPIRTTATGQTDGCGAGRRDELGLKRGDAPKIINQMLTMAVFACSFFMLKMDRKRLDTNND